MKIVMLLCFLIALTYQYRSITILEARVNNYKTFILLHAYKQDSLTFKCRKCRAKNMIPLYSDTSIFRYSHQIKAMQSTLFTNGNKSISEQLKERLSHPGEITTKEAHEIFGGSYFSFSPAFKLLMYDLVAEGKAIKIRNGKYRIISKTSKHEPNRFSAASFGTTRNLSDPYGRSVE